MVMVKERPRPEVVLDYCKGCGRCVDSCNKGCLVDGTEIHPATGLIPVKLDLSNCSACGLCFDACPEPFGLVARDVEPAAHEAIPAPADVPDTPVALPASEPLILKGNYAAAVGAVVAGCRHFFGYPITPSTEGAELMAKMLPRIDGVFVQAISEVATVNMMYGCGAAGLPSMTFTSSPGFSLMLEGISYMVGAEVPGVFVNVMRGGPGLGNIAPEQSDIKLMCRGLGHGNTHCIVLSPSTPQEMLDFAILAFDLSFRYRNPVMLAADGYLGQMTGKVVLPPNLNKPGVPAWAVYGDRAHRRNMISSIQLAETDLEVHNQHLNKKYALMTEREQRADLFRCEDAEIVLLGCNTPGRMAKGAVETLRAEGVKAGLFRPQTLWPFPFRLFEPLLGRVKRIVVVEASSGQLEDELRLALSKAGRQQHPPIDHVRRMGGVLPSQAEIAEAVRVSCQAAAEVRA